MAMKIRVRYKSRVVTMNLSGKGKGSFQYRRDVRYVVSNFICEKGYTEYVNVFKNKTF